jgi:hypothetical protein
MKLKTQCITLLAAVSIAPTARAEACNNVATCLYWENGGQKAAATGIHGHSYANGVGIKGTSTGGPGVYGSGGTGVYGISSSGYGVVGSSAAAVCLASPRPRA